MEARILIVDDDSANIDFLQHALRPAGFTDVHGCSDPRQAVRLFRELRPDLVALDLLMPHLSGEDLLRRLRELTPAGDYLPLVVLTSDATPEAMRRAMSAGAYDFLRKPPSPYEVRMRLRNLLETRRLQMELRKQNRYLEFRVAARTATLAARSRELERARMDVLERLARAAEYRDDDTGKHTIRVGTLSALLAAEIGVPEREVAMLRLIAPLHDVGKIGIADSILLKPGRLSDEEFATMRTHTIIGAEILSGSGHETLVRAQEIAISHHERWDGSGYPRGLSGEDIPLFGRMLSITDVYDSLTHARPYKRAWSIAETLGELQAQRGRQFDPRLLDAFLRLHARGAVTRALREIGGEALSRAADLGEVGDATVPDRSLQPVLA